MTNKQHPIFQISPEITAFPVIQKSILWTIKLKEFMMENSFDCVAVMLPEAIKKEIIQGVSKLPEIHCVYYNDYENDTIIVPIDPCEPTIEAIKTALEEKLAIEFVDSNLSIKYSHESFYPDSYAVRFLNNFEYFLTLIPKIIDKNSTSDTDIKRYAHVAEKLFQLSLKYKNILFVTDFLDIVKIKEFYNNFEFPKEKLPDPQLVELLPVKKKHLYFILGELPYTAYSYVSRSIDIFGEDFQYEDVIKKIVVESRQLYMTENPDSSISLNKLNNLLKFARNSSLMNRKLFPDLFTLIRSCQKVINDDFVLSLIKTAKIYPYNKDEYNNPLKIFPDLLKKTGSDTLEPYYNYFDASPKNWQEIILDLNKKKSLSYTETANKTLLGIVSYPPEDIFLENFANSIKENAKLMLNESVVKTEKFSTSTGDGINIRETLRNLNEDIYINIINKKPEFTDIDSTVIIFDDDNDMLYPEKGVLYAEHHNESTLGYYSTPFTEYEVAPGIFKALYGGIFLLYPPVIIDNFWEWKNYPDYIESNSEKLTFAACRFSRSKCVAFISSKKPNEKIRDIFSMFDKKLVYIHSGRLSQKKLKKIRTFHILKNKKMRKIAHKFINNDLN